MQYRARYRARTNEGKYVTTQAFVVADSPEEARTKADSLLEEIKKKLEDREAKEVTRTVCWKIEEHTPRTKRK